MKPIIVALGAAAACCLLSWSPSRADPPELGWSESAELGLVTTAGNSSALTISFNNVTKRIWENAEFRFELGIVRASSRGDRYGVGSLASFSVEEPSRQIDAERYLGKARYDRAVTKMVFWFVSATAERNLPANVEHRYTGTGGAGATWIDTDDVTLRTFLGLNYTQERLAVEGTDDFGGFQIGCTYDDKLTETTTLNSALTLDEDFEDLENLRGDFHNAVSVSVNDHLALKASLRFLYRHLPALQVIDVYDADPSRGGALVGTAEIRKDKLDTSFSTSLVLTF